MRVPQTVSGKEEAELGHIARSLGLDLSVLDHKRTSGGQETVRYATPQGSVGVVYEGYIS